VIAREGALRRSRDPLSYAIGVILIHLAVVLVHGLTHSRLGIGLNAVQERDFRRGGDYGCAARGCVSLVEDAALSLSLMLIAVFPANVHAHPGAVATPDHRMASSVTYSTASFAAKCDLVFGYPI
jgi:hypothetical protein